MNVALPASLRAAVFRLAFPVWTLAVAVGFVSLDRFSLAPSHVDPARSQWPLATAKQSHPVRRTLAVFVHPQCPCTRASLGELSEISGQTLGELTVEVYVVVPPGAPPGWARGAISRLAGENPSAHVIVDTDAAVAARFGARISGETFVYGPDGRLEFHGGITGSRGHRGANAGRNAVITLAHTGAAGIRVTPVFGCELFDELCTRDPTSCRL